MQSCDVLTDKKILLTGGGGFIGSHLAARLLDAGALVSIADKYNGIPWRLEPLRERIEYYSADITDLADLSEVFNVVRPACVFHLAAYGVDSADHDAATAVRVNVLGMVNVLEAMKKTGCSRIVCMGSGSEYGNFKGKVSETRSLKPINIYGSTKAASTLISHQYAAEHGIEIVTLRPFGVFGEGESPHKLFCYAILTMLKGLNLELTSCEQTRDYCHVENIIDALIACMCAEDIKNGVFNVGSGTSMPLKFYIEMLSLMIKPRGAVFYGKLPQRNEAWAPEPDIGKIKDVLGWAPRISLCDGLERTIAWYKKNKHLYEEYI